MTRGSSLHVSVTGTKLCVQDIRRFARVDDTGLQYVAATDLLEWLQSSTLGENRLLSPSAGEHVLQVNDLMASFRYVFPDDRDSTLYIAESLGALARVQKGVGWDFDSVLMLMEMGFVIPPFTVLDGIYRLWPQSVLRLSARRDRWQFTVASRFGSADRVTDKSYEEAMEAVACHLQAAVSEAVGQKAHRETVFTVSGGIDSSLLLVLGSGVLGPGMSVAATVKSPGQLSEYRRAAAAASLTHARQHIVLDASQISRRIEREFVRAFQEPIYDDAAVAEVALIRAVREKTGNDALHVVEGQGADTVFLGLPHNQVMALRRSLGQSVRRFPRYVANLVAAGRWWDRGSRIGRMLYRAEKAMTVLGLPLDEEAFLASLGVRGAFRELSDAYYVRISDTVARTVSGSASWQRAVANFFLSMVLPVREMQKYRLSLREGVTFSFPYLHGGLLSLLDGLPDEYLITATKRKRILFDLSSKILPRSIHTNSTAPFYIGVAGGGGGARADRSQLEVFGPARRVLDREILGNTVDHLFRFAVETGMPTAGLEGCLESCGIKLSSRMKELAYSSE